MVTILTLTTPTPLLAALAVIGLIATGLYWLIWWPRSQRKSQPPSRLAWEIIADPPSDRKELYISDENLALIGPEYQHVGDMPAQFMCPHCLTPENVQIKLYHHIPSHTIIILSRHGCRWIEDLTVLDTVQVPAVQGGARVQNPTTHF
jgi:hypothetical protein